MNAALANPPLPHGAAPANDSATLTTVRTCDRCGVSAWHPEAASCVAADCPLHLHAQSIAPSKV